jgi:hypothetical protein
MGMHKKRGHAKFDLSGDSIAHTNKNKPSINPKWHQLLAHHLNIHIIRS